MPAYATTTCFSDIAPLGLSIAVVKTQVESQIKVRDFSRASVSISPAEFGSWSDARAELLTEAKRPLKAQVIQLQHELIGVSKAPWLHSYTSMFLCAA